MSPEAYSNINLDADDNIAQELYIIERRNDLDAIPWTVVALVALMIIGLMIFLKRQNEKKAIEDVSRQFLSLGTIFVIIGTIYSLINDMNVFDVAFFNLGLIFVLTGSIQMITNRLWGKRI